MTAHDLLIRLSADGVTVSVEDDDIVVEGDLPAEAEPVIDLLRAPLVALLTGRTLYCFTSEGRPYGPHGILSPKDLLPWDTRLLCASGGDWDRISGFARTAFPDLFGPDPAAMKKATKRKGAA